MLLMDTFDPFCIPFSRLEMILCIILLSRVLAIRYFIWTEVAGKKYFWNRDDNHKDWRRSHHSTCSYRGLSLFVLKMQLFTLTKNPVLMIETSQNKD